MTALLLLYFFPKAANEGKARISQTTFCNKICVKKSSTLCSYSKL